MQKNLNKEIFKYGDRVYCGAVKGQILKGIFRGWSMKSKVVLTIERKRTYSYYNACSVFNNFRDAQLYNLLLNDVQILYSITHRKFIMCSKVRIKYTGNLENRKMTLQILAQGLWLNSCDFLIDNYEIRNIINNCENETASLNHITFMSGNANVQSVSGYEFIRKAGAMGKRLCFQRVLN